MYASRLSKAMSFWNSMIGKCEKKLTRWRSQYISFGMPLGVKLKAMDIWNSVIGKCEKKLTIWKSQDICLDGWVTFINFLLDALSTNMMSIFPIPDGEIKSLDKIGEIFFWKGLRKMTLLFALGENERGSMGKETRGFRSEKFENSNKALRLKWLWRYSQEP